MTLAIALLLSYLVGSIPTSVWVGRSVYGLDVRAHGSGNAGATNVYRVLGWKAGLFVLLFDAFKGWAASVWVASLALPSASATGGEATEVGIRLACGVAAILGHSFPVFAGFRGGKGVATSAGVLLALTPGALGIALAAFVVAVAATRHVALGSLAAAAAYPATLYAQRFALGQPLPTVLLAVGTAMGAWIFWTHRTNIRRLLRGEESRLEFGKTVRGMDTGAAARVPDTDPPA